MTAAPRQNQCPAANIVNKPLNMPVRDVESATA
jgi:hypothetical protein